jgi:sialic acid synthase SpsE
MKTPYIIAEIGSNCFKFGNENKNIDEALVQIKHAKTAGADAVKFQFFTAFSLWGPECKGKYFAQVQNKYAMPAAWLPVLKKSCLKNNIDFLCTAFCPAGYKTVDRYVSAHKLASPEITALDIAVFMNKTDKRRIISLGCAGGHEPFDGLYNLRPKDSILECVSDYPANPTHYNLPGVKALARRYRCRWGISDHTKHTWLAVYARSIGASVFEKHVDFTAYGATTPDTDVSVSGVDFQKYVKEIKSQKIIDHKKIKQKHIDLYARIKTKSGWYRPCPQDV